MATVVGFEMVVHPRKDLKHDVNTSRKVYPAIGGASVRRVCLSWSAVAGILLVLTVMRRMDSISVPGELASREIARCILIF